MTIVHSDSLRAAAECAGKATGLRAEIIFGVIVISPTPRGQHFGNVARVRDSLIAQVSGFAIGQNASVQGAESEDYATPDLIVADRSFENSPDWLINAVDVDLVVEVAGPGGGTRDAQEMPLWYAAAGVPTYLLLDPRSGVWTLFTEPEGGRYRGRFDGSYGKPVELRELGVIVPTEDLPLYT